MSERRVDGFFYGLFMDGQVLRDNQIRPENLRRAYVDDYALRIGRRATLVSSPGARAYGIVYALTHDDLERLYGAAGLEQYRPEAMLVKVIGGESLPALCYNLLQAPEPGEANVEYAALLRAALGRLEFPAEYIATVA